MGKYIKKFSTDSDRVEYEGSESYLEPYVSYVEGDNFVHYNKPPEIILVATFNVADASQPTLLYAFNWTYVDDDDTSWDFINLGADMFSKVEIDETKISIQDLDTAQGQYQLSTGEHTVKYTLKDPTFIGIEMDIEKAEIKKLGAVFDGCSCLTGMIIPDNVTSIGGYTFEGCESLTSITIPDSITSIGEAAFVACFSLTSIRIPDSVTSIGEAAFGVCSGLTNVTIGSGVTSIGDDAFTQCRKLTSVTVEAATPPTLGSEVFFRNGSGRKIYVPAASVEAYKAAANWSAYASYIEAIP